MGAAATELIRSDAPQQRVDFEHCRNAQTVAISLDDSSQDASWTLNVFVERDAGGWALLGALLTIPPAASPFGSWGNRLVAICSVPGARNWQIYPVLAAGTPVPGKRAVRANLSMSRSELLGDTCCPVAAIPGNSTLVAAGAAAQATKPLPGEGYASEAAESVAVIQNGGASPALVRFTSLGAALFGQVFNGAAEPAAGAVPISEAMLGAGGDVEELVYPVPTDLFPDGVVVVFSTTLGTYTAAPAGSGLFEVALFPVVGA